MALKVFGWQSRWNDPRMAGYHKQVRRICAAKSKAEIVRVHNLRKSDLWNCCVTGNAREIAIASEAPLTIFAASDTVYDAPFYVMKEPDAL